MTGHIAAYTTEEHPFEFALGVSPNHQKPCSFIVRDVAKPSARIANGEHRSVVDALSSELVSERVTHSTRKVTAELSKRDWEAGI
jgi:hypothetical protein